MNALFADGGVISKNPSSIGGTWAFRIISKDVVVCERSGVITPLQADLPTITNNLTEMLALVRGLQTLCLTPKWTGVIYSDSQITLGRVFEGWKWTGIPAWLHKEYQSARSGLLCWDEIQHVLLSGHPTKAQLEAGTGSGGRPVSIHNVWCDKACGEEAKKFMEFHYGDVPF
jgi:ribonuclease HI